MLLLSRTELGGWSLQFFLPLAVIKLEGIGDISVNLDYHVLNFKFRWVIGGIEGKDLGVDVIKWVIFSYYNPFYL